MPPSSPQISAALKGLREILSRDKEEGAERISIAPESLQQLRELPERLARRPKGVESPVVQEVPAATASGKSKADRIAALRVQAEHCEDCRALKSLRDTMVFSVGNPNADVMFVGEAPGFEEEKQREPFVGPAGQKLTQIIQVMGLRRPEDIYISNIVKFRPMIGDGRFQGPKNRKPTPEEMETSVKYVEAEIEIVQPKVIVALGGTATEGLLNQSGSVAKMRNQFHDLNGTPVMVTYHPSYLLRAETNSADNGKSEKRKVWEDMLLVMEKIGLAISDKQRQFFL